MPPSVHRSRNKLQRERDPLRRSEKKQRKIRGGVRERSAHKHAVYGGGSSLAARESRTLRAAATLKIAPRHALQIASLQLRSIGGASSQIQRSRLRRGGRGLVHCIAARREAMWARQTLWLRA